MWNKSTNEKCVKNVTNFVTEPVPIAPMPPIKHLLLTERYVAPGAKLQMSKYNTNTITNTLTKELWWIKYVKRRSNLE